MTLDNYDAFYAPERFATITVVHRAKWWKRPFLRLLGRPTRWEFAYPDMKIESMTVAEDGGLRADFTIAPVR